MKQTAQATSQHVSAMGSALDGLMALPDGILCVASDRRIIFLNPEAASMLGVRATDVTGQDFSHLGGLGGYDDWSPILGAVAERMNGEFLLRGGIRSAILVTVRRAGPDNQAMVVQLHDLEVFDHARRRASGMQTPRESTGSNRKMRPDFAKQRQISRYLDTIMSRGERALLYGAGVLISGESGVGKTEVARHLHSYISEPSNPFVAVNCAAIPETLFETELFGYEKGAFTGALNTGRKGLIEQADGGTLFLDEVGEIPLQLQSKLLSFIEERTIQRAGGGRQKAVNVRLISATNRDLRAMVAEDRFRLDLYFRLAVVELTMKPLRETRELIPHLIERFSQFLNERLPEPMRIGPGLLRVLHDYDYPGNVRELYNIMQQVVVLGEDEVLGRLDAPQSRGGAVEPGPDAPEMRGLKQMVAEYERDLIEQAIRHYGSKRRAAAALNVDIGTIVRKTRVLS
jgi:sigma-54 dependent transcriptional regulator, acetoin dehydrogenase operon transcriptional activator AcoR